MLERRGRQNQRGFTLLELLVVVVILGVLSAVVVIAVSGFTRQSQSAACEADRRTIIDAEERYNAQLGEYGTEAQLVSHGDLRSASKLSDVALTTGNYDVVPAGECVPEGLAASGSSGSAAAVRLLTSGGAGLEGASIEYSAGSWISLGTTDANGAVGGSLTPGSYDLRIDYRGQTQTINGATIAAGTPFDIHTVSLIVAIPGGTAPAGIAHVGNDGYWMSDDDTDGSGLAHLDLLPGSYAVRADYRGTTNAVSGISVPGEPVVAFGLVHATVVVGHPGVTVEHRGNNGIWIDDGTTDGSGLLGIDVLHGDYDFRAEVSPGQYGHAQVALTGNTVVVVS